MVKDHSDNESKSATANTLATIFNGGGGRGEGGGGRGRLNYLHAHIHLRFMHAHQETKEWLPSLCSRGGIFNYQQGMFYMHHATYRIVHTTTFVTPIMEHWLEWEIAQWIHRERSIQRPIAPWADLFTTELRLTGKNVLGVFINK